MSKTQCKNDEYKEKKDADFRCTNCNRTAGKKKKLCKPKKVK